MNSVLGKLQASIFGKLCHKPGTPFKGVSENQGKDDMEVGGLELKNIR